MWFEYLLAAVIVLVILAIARATVVRVRAEEAAVVERGGQFLRVLQAGWHVIIPFRDRLRPMYWRAVETGLDGQERVVDRLRKRIDLRPVVFSLPNLQVSTGDQVPFKLSVALSVMVADARAALYAQSHLPRALTELASGYVQEQVAKLSAEGLIKDLVGTASAVKDGLLQELDALGLKATDVVISSAVPADEIRAAIEKKVAAATEKEAAVLEAQGKAQAALEEGHSKQELEIMAAEAKRKAMRLVAEAEADAIRKIGAAIDNPELARHALALRYLDVLREMAAGAGTKTVFIPYEAGVSIGHLDLIRQALEDKS